MRRVPIVCSSSCRAEDMKVFAHCFRHGTLWAPSVQICDRSRTGWLTACLVIAWLLTDVWGVSLFDQQEIASTLLDTVQVRGRKCYPWQATCCLCEGLHHRLFSFDEDSLLIFQAYYTPARIKPNQSTEKWQLREGELCSSPC